MHCFDRIIAFGSFREIQYAGAMEGYLWRQNVKYIDYEKKFANKLRLQMVEHVRAVASYYSVDIDFVNSDVRKEDYVAEKLAQRGRRKGVVCILSCMEPCRCYKVRKDQETGRLCLKNCPGKCKTYYIYLIDEELGLCYLRVPTWAPFRLQVYFNGHDWLERKMKQEGIRFQKVDNTFVHISDFDRANELAEQMDHESLEKRFNQLACRWVSVFDRFNGDIHWSFFQAEMATDIVFKNDRILPQIYEDIVRTAVCEIKCPDVYEFLSRRINKNTKEFAEGRLQTLIQGTRIKHSIKSTSIKMYDKQDRVLRIETTTSDVSSFYCYRRVVSRDGKSSDYRSAQIRKALSSLAVVRDKLLACNRRYLGAISQMEDRLEEKHRLKQVVESKKDSKGRSFRGINFYLEDDLLFLNAILQGRNHIMGLRNQSLQHSLPGWSPQKIGRNLRRFRELKLLKKVAGTTKYYITKLGNDVLVAALQVRERIVMPALKTT